MSKKLIISSVAFFSLLMPIQVFAKPNISLVLESKKVLVDKSTKKESLVDAKDVKPGDVILYKIKVSNSGDTAALEVKPVGNIPDKTIYIPVEKQTLKTFFSIDKGSTFQEKPKITVREKGKDVSKDAPIEMYSKIQWLINKVNPSQVVELKYRVKVK